MRTLSCRRLIRRGRAFQNSFDCCEKRLPQGSPTCIFFPRAFVLQIGTSTRSDLGGNGYADSYFGRPLKRPAMLTI